MVELPTELQESEIVGSCTTTARDVEPGKPFSETRVVGKHHELKALGQYTVYVTYDLAYDARGVLVHKGSPSKRFYERFEIEVVK